MLAYLLNGAFGNVVIAGEHDDTMRLRQGRAHPVGELAAERHDLGGGEMPGLAHGCVGYAIGGGGQYGGVEQARQRVGDMGVAVVAVVRRQNTSSSYRWSVIAS